MVGVGTHEVWARAVWGTYDLAVRNGLPLANLFQGLSFDETSVRRMRRVTWDDYCQFIERIEERAGGPKALERLMESDYHTSSPELRAIARALVSPKAFATVVIDLVNPIAFPSVSFAVHDLGPDRIRAVTSLRPGARPCATWFRGNVGGLRGLPHHLDLPAAEVTAELSDVGGVYECSLPPSQTLAASAERGVRTMVHRLIGQFLLRDSPHLAGSPIAGGGAGDGGELGQRLLRATRAWDLTARQVEVLELLAQGETNKEIGGALGCAENTVELHVTQLLRKSGSASRSKLIARFWATL